MAKRPANEGSSVFTVNLRLATLNIYDGTGFVTRKDIIKMGEVLREVQSYKSSHLVSYIATK